MDFRLPLVGLLALVGSPGLAADAAAQDRAPVGGNTAADGEFLSGLAFLPDTARGLVHIADVPELLERWEQTSLSQMMHDPVMTPFREGQKQAIERELAEAGLQIGVQLSDLRDVASGEALIGWLLHDDPQRPYTVCLMADTRGRDAETARLLAQIDTDLRARNAQVQARRLGEAEIRTYTLPRRAGEFVVEQVAITRVGGRLIAADHPATVATLLRAAANPTAGTPVAAAADFRRVRQRLEADQDGQLFWFARPFGLARILRAISRTDRGQRLDVVQLLENQGFGVIESAGGYIHVHDEAHQLRHRGFIDAPGEKELAARMLQFPNRQGLEPPAWVLSEAGSYMDLNWRMKDAFLAAQTLVDEAFGDEMFFPTLEGIRDDPDGPQIDILGAIVENFDNRLILVTDNVLPATEESERMLVAVKLRNASEVQGSIERWMRNEPNAEQIEFPGHPIWEIQQDGDPDGFDLQGLEDFGFDLPNAQNGLAAGEAPLLEQWALTVYDGYLMFSSHSQMLVDVIEQHQQNAAPLFAASEEYQRVIQAMQARGIDDWAAERVVRPDRSWRVKYELLRQGKLRESDSVLALLLRRLFENPDRPQQQAPQIQGNQLPPFEAIERFLGVGGGALRSEQAGWSLDGFLLQP